MIRSAIQCQRVIDYAKATGQSAKLERMLGEIGEMVKAQGEYLKAHTVLQTLLYVNSDAEVAQDLGFYHLEARYGEPGDYAGPDLLAEWYRRNVRIYNNVAKLLTTPEDRILAFDWLEAPHPGGMCECSELARVSSAGDAAVASRWRP